MVRTRIALVLLLPAAMFAAPNAAAQATAPLDTSLTRVNDLWARSYATNDTVTAIQLFSDNLLVLSANGTQKDKAAELADVRASERIRMRHFTTSEVQTRRQGNLGLVTGNAEWAFESAGRTRTVRRGYSASYVRRGPLGWQLVGLRMGPPGGSLVAGADGSRAEVQQLLASMVSAFKSAPASVARFYSDDAHIIGGGMNAGGRQQVDAYWAGTTGFASWTLELVDAGGDPASPWVIGRSTITSTSGRTMPTDFVGFLQRGADGQLRFVADVYAGVPAPRMP